VAATGEGGRGMLVGSSSFVPSGDGAPPDPGPGGAVEIDVAAGGSVSAGATAREAIAVIGGQTQKIANAGTVRAANPDSHAIRLRAAREVEITNSGTLLGSVLVERAPEGGLVSFDSTGRLEPGREVSLGSEGTFASSGTVSPGGDGTIAKTTVTASSATLSGTFEVDYDMGGGADPFPTADMIAFEGGAVSVGEVTVKPRPPSTIPQGAIRTYPVTVLSGAGVDDGTYAVADTAVIGYALQASADRGPDSPELISLVYTVDFIPFDGPRGLAAGAPVFHPNHVSFGQYLDRLVFDAPEGIDDDFRQDLARYTFAVPDIPGLIAAYGEFIADEAFAATDASVMSSTEFARRLRGCGDGLDVPSAGRCSWGDVSLGRTERDGRGGMLDYDEATSRLSFGGQIPTSEGLMLGAGLSYETGDLTAGAASGEVDRVQLGASLGGDVAGGRLTGAVTLGRFDVDLTRSVRTPDGTRLARSDADGTIASLTLQYERSLALGPGLSLHQLIAGGAYHVRQEGFCERGAGGYGLDVGGIEHTTFALNPAVGLRSQTRLGGRPATLSGRVGALALFGDDREAEARLIGVGLPSGPSFTMRDEADAAFLSLGGFARRGAFGERHDPRHLRRPRL
jgi:hypothetical protein